MCSWQRNILNRPKWDVFYLSTSKANACNNVTCHLKKNNIYIIIYIFSRCCWKKNKRLGKCNKYTWTSLNTIKVRVYCHTDAPQYWFYVIESFNVRVIYRLQSKIELMCLIFYNFIVTISYWSYTSLDIVLTQWNYNS